MLNLLPELWEDGQAELVDQVKNEGNAQRLHVTTNLYQNPSSEKLASFLFCETQPKRGCKRFLLIVFYLDVMCMQTKHF